MVVPVGQVDVLATVEADEADGEHEGPDEEGAAGVSADAQKFGLAEFYFGILCGFFEGFFF